MDWSGVGRDADRNSDRDDQYASTHRVFRTAGNRQAALVSSDADSHRALAGSAPRIRCFYNPGAIQIRSSVYGKTVDSRSS